ncbi:DNA polymerase/3'-5' exonuclease PolX [Vitiosangium sp. GDMCC 1.1324]|uniref:DNA polymerase/3'-5' exonuclease PolX n=1 Tax=Vitiosangium sp. (strain GDMCC 1.1324) TaxID=2138576 RepID=UPI000D387691|nr:DNA polymerase/3'-5' exonuclease PolX [Vitiosangium sp. GDMCC 1.1324]PTL84438.1 DNA polymerase/3'-5' exonuclease PolX [Vitiosangium sp. GDMCC 1.1324]
MENAEVVAMLGEIADLLELTNENPFKVRSYRRAAQVVDTLPVSISELVRKGELAGLPGVGEHTAQRIAQFVEKATCDELERLRGKVPPGVMELLRVESVGPKTAALAWKELGVTSVDALEEAALSGRLAELPRLGSKRAEAIVSAVARYRSRQGRVPLHRALPYAEELVERLRAIPGVKQAVAAGSLRRRKETVGDLDLLVSSTDPGRVVSAFPTLPGVATLLAQGPTKSTVRLSVGLQVDLRVLPPESFGAALHYFTGSKAHNIALRTRAVHRGLKVSEYGVFDAKGRRIAGEREEDVFRAVGLPWIPPELREGLGELEAAEAGRLPELIEEEDLRGDLHVHSEASSDASSSLLELASAARGFGRSYLAITDHSRSRPLGLDEARLWAHVDTIRWMDRELRGRPHLLTGIEVDILPNGSLDLDASVLSELDCVVASVHSRFNMSSEEMTERIVRALRSGLVHVLGHPSGRLIGSRDPYPYDLERVLEVAREERVALEVNAQPERLDLTDTACRMAKQAGVKLVISSDSHNARHLENLRYGVWVARRGWLESGDVLNTLPLSELRRHFRRSRRVPAPTWADEGPGPSP